MTKTEMQAAITALEATLADLPEAGECAAVELEGARIPVEWVEVGGVRLGLDSGGTTVRVELPELPLGWTAEHGGGR